MPKRFYPCHWNGFTKYSTDIRNSRSVFVSSRWGALTYLRKQGIAKMDPAISDDNDHRLDLSREESAEPLPHLSWLPLSWNYSLMCNPSNNANDDDTIWNQYSSCDESVLSDSGDASLDILLDDTPYNGALN